MAEEDHYDDVFKVVVIGDSGVGKTNMIQTFTKQEKPKNTGATMGIEYSSKTIKLSSNQRVKAQIWDTTGQQQYRSLTKNQLKKAIGGLVVFDVTNKKTFQSVDYWIETLKNMTVEHVQIILVGNKADLAHKRVISFQAAQSTANRYNIQYVQTTINDLPSLQKTFSTLCQKIFNMKSNQKNFEPQYPNIQSNTKLNSFNNPETKSKGCSC